TSGTYSSYLSQVTSTGTGAFSINLLDNSLITPAGSGWAIVVQSNSSAMGNTYFPVSVSGASQSLSSYLSINAVAPRFPAIYGAFGYADVEVTPIPNAGASYFNTTSNLTRVWNGVAWQNSSGSGSPPT